MHEPVNPGRRPIVDLLPLRPGECVLDVGCGTGLCLEMLRDRVGPGGRVVGVDASQAMLAHAVKRAAEGGWDDVTLLRAPAEELALAEPVDHVLLCAVHDVMRSAAALEAVLGQLRPGGSVAAGGGMWAPACAVGLNLAVAAPHAPYVRDFTGFERPGRSSPSASSSRCGAMGTGSLAGGRVPAA